MEPHAVSVRREVQSGRTFEFERILRVRVADAYKRKVTEQHWSRHDAYVFGLDPRREADEQMSASECHTPKRFNGRRSTDAVEGHIDTPPTGGVEDSRDEVISAIVNCDIGAEFGGESELVRAPCSRYHSGTACASELHSGRPRTPSSGVHEHGVVGGEVGTFVERERCDMERHVNRRCGCGIHVVGHRESHRNGRNRYLRVPAEGTGGNRGDRAFRSVPHPLRPPHVRGREPPSQGYTVARLAQSGIGRGFRRCR